MIKTITIVNDFSQSPYGRNEDDVTPEEYKNTGKAFRETLLAPALRDKSNDKVIVILTGYNRYGRSFLDEAFGGLIRKDGFTYQELLERLEYKHDTVKSIVNLISERLVKAAKDLRQLPDEDI